MDGMAHRRHRVGEVTSGRRRHSDRRLVRGTLPVAHPHRDATARRTLRPHNDRHRVDLRSPAGFLSSWRQHLEHDFFRRSSDPGSFAYVADDSWLVDYDALKGAYDGAFHGRLTTIDYDSSLARDGSIIPALVATFTDVSLDSLPEWRTYRLNRSARPPRKPVKGLARPRHYIRWWKWRLVQALRNRK